MRITQIEYPRSHYTHSSNPSWCHSPKPFHLQACNKAIRVQKDRRRTPEIMAIWKWLLLLIIFKMALNRWRT